MFNSQYLKTAAAFLPKWASCFLSVIVASQSISRTGVKPNSYPVSMIGKIWLNHWIYLRWYSGKTPQDSKIMV